MKKEITGRQVVFKCHQIHFGEAMALFLKSGCYITAVSPYFTSMVCKQPGLVFFWVKENAASIFLKSVIHSTVSKPVCGIQYSHTLQQMPGHKINLPHQEATYSDLVSYVTDSRFKRRSHSILAVSPPVPGRKMYVLFKADS